LWRDESGAAMLEFTATMVGFLLILFGTVEFGMAYYQWNAATKAVQWGARLAAVSRPVSSDLETMTGLSAGVLPGDPMPAFDRTCSGATGSCTGGGTYSAAAMQTIVFGRGKTVCNNFETEPRLVGMCNFFPRLTTVQNVEVRYQHTGLGYAGRPGGPVPTVTVRIVNMQYQFLLLGFAVNLLPGFTSTVNLPSFATTVTGEDLKNFGF
jgi:Flp pilus assembly protein TadG